MMQVVESNRAGDLESNVAVCIVQSAVKILLWDSHMRRLRNVYVPVCSFSMFMCADTCFVQ